MEKRDNNMDFLRILAAFMVICQHVLAVYIHRVDNNLEGYYEIASIFMSISVYAVPIFVMISGAFLLSDSDNKNYEYFYKKMVNKIIIPTIIWSMIYIIYTIIKNYIAYGKAIDKVIYGPIINLLQGKPYTHLWYLYMIIGLYLITPILIRIKNEIDEDKFNKLAIIFMIIGVVINLTCKLYWILWFTEYIGYFILGYTLRNKYKKCKGNFKVNVVVIISCSIIMFLSNIYLNKHSYDNNLYFFGNLSMFNIIGSIALFNLFLKIRNFKREFYNISKYSFTIYLIHQGIIDILGIIKEKIILTKFNPLWFVPVMSIIVFLLSYIFSYCISRIETLKTNKIVNLNRILK